MGFRWGRDARPTEGGETGWDGMVGRGETGERADAEGRDQRIPARVAAAYGLYCVYTLGHSIRRSAYSANTFAGGHRKREPPAIQ